MQFRYGYIVLLLSLAALCACESRKLEGDGETTLRSVHLALSLDTQNSVGTKADVSEFTEMQDIPIFRGLAEVRVVPFKDHGVIGPDSEAHNRQMDLPGFVRLNSTTSSYLYSSGIDIWIPTKTASMLLYGHAPIDGDDAAAYHRFGSLIATGFDKSNPALKASSLGFEPDLMFKGSGQPKEAEVIRDILNDILKGKSYSLQAYYGPVDSEGNAPATWATVNWNDNIGDLTLREAFLQMTNEGAVVSGSGPLVEALLTSLYSLLTGYQSYNSDEYEVIVDGIVYEARKGPEPDSAPLLYKDLYNGLRNNILDYIKGVTDITVKDVIKIDEKGHVIFVDEAVSTYPENLGLPSGCAVLRWTPTGFVIPEMDGVEGLAPMDRYCFPPSLYYYANTTIQTSDKDNIAAGYESYSSWSRVLQDYDLGTEVTANTKSVALVNPAQFGVGMISATVQAVNSRLQDNDGLVETTVEAVDTNLQVTGIIVGRQYAQTFDFKPNFDPDHPEKTEEYFLYDNEIPGVYVFKPTEEEAKHLTPIRTLSLQTPDNMDTYFCLELKNNTGVTFHGAEGRVLPGRKFYLVGKLEMPTLSIFDSVVVKGRITEVTCYIHSLAGAYNCVPDLGKPQLVVGIQTAVNWKLATPSTIMLE